MKRIRTNFSKWLILDQQESSTIITKIDIIPTITINIVKIATNLDCSINISWLLWTFTIYIIKHE